MLFEPITTSRVPVLLLLFLSPECRVHSSLSGQKVAGSLAFGENL